MWELQCIATGDHTTPRKSFSALIAMPVPSVKSVYLSVAGDGEISTGSDGNWQYPTSRRALCVNCRQTVRWAANSSRWCHLVESYKLTMYKWRNGQQHERRCLRHVLIPAILWSFSVDSLALQRSTSKLLPNRVSKLSGLPTHKLNIKLGAPVMLLRNTTTCTPSA